jgi:hypothetical protein
MLLGLAGAVPLPCAVADFPGIPLSATERTSDKASPVQWPLVIFLPLRQNSDRLPHPKLRLSHSEIIHIRLAVLSKLMLTLWIQERYCPEVGAFTSQSRLANDLRWDSPISPSKQ